jgi:DNA-binding GntR family transcriptional regulator
MQYPRAGGKRKPEGATAGHVSRSRSVYTTLRDRIVHGRLPAHARLVETKLAHALRVSRTPVRDALAQLVRDGFVVAARGSRRLELIVAPLTADGVEEIWALIGGIEAAAASRIDLLRPRDRVALADRLTAVNRALTALGVHGGADPDRYAELQGAFHGALVTACGGDRIRAAHEAVRPHVARYERARAVVAHRASRESLAEHAAIIRAIRRGRGDQACNAVLRHWLNAARRTAALVASTDGAPA